MSVRIRTVGEYEAQTICSHCRNGAKDLPVGFRTAIEGRESDFPTLALAVRNSAPATNPKIEWLDGGFAAWNYTEIVRTPFNPDQVSEDEALISHLRKVEEILLFGVPTLKDTNQRLCGGVYHFLDRAPRETDTLKLRPLRDLRFLANRQAPDYDGRLHEWISEFSLQVNRA